VELERLWADGALISIAAYRQVILGFASATIDATNNDAELVGLFVDPTHWRRGIGTALTEAMASRISETGGRNLYVFANPLARPFYDANGFTFVRNVPMAHHPDVPLLVRRL